MKIAKVSVVVLVAQLLIVSTIAAKYLYQRWRCPRVWARTVAYDPQLPLRGRYLRLQLVVDGCRSTLPSAKGANFPRNSDGTVKNEPFWIQYQQRVPFEAKLRVEGDKLVAIKAEGEPRAGETQTVAAWPGQPCSEMRLEHPVDFYIAEHANDPSWVKAGQELWIEVTVPPKGPPRPIQLALKDNGVWKPLAF